MTDAQFGVLIAALTAGLAAIAGAIRWAVGRVVKSNDDAVKALIDNTASNAVLGVKMDQVVASNTALAGKLDAIVDFVEDHTDERPRHRIQTPASGVRAKTVREG